MKFINRFLWLLLVLALLSSCSTPEEKARQELVKKNIQPSAEALIAQIKEGNNDNVHLLLKAGVPADTPGENGSPALAMAAAAGQLAAMDILIAAGADTDKEDIRGDTPLILAVKKNQPAAAAKLIQAGAKSDTINKLGETALSIAIRDENWPMVRTLGEAGVNLDLQDKYGRTRLFNAIVSGEGDSGFAEALILGGADVNIPDQEGMTPFSVAVNRNSVGLVAFMVKKGADINGVLHSNQTSSALMQAVAMGNAEMARILIDAGADVNFIEQETGETCLYKAVYNKREDIVPLLVKAGAEVNTHNVFRDTPLARATLYANTKNLEIAETLVGAGADLNAVITDDGYTLLHLAVMQSDEVPDALQFLLDKGAAADRYDNAGHTPLTLAVQNNKLQAVMLLIKAGVDVDFSAMNGKSPLALANEYDYYQIAAKLRSAGAARD